MNILSTTTLSILCGLVGMLGWGIYDFLGGVFARRLGPLRTFLWSQVAGLGGMLLLAVILAPSWRVPGRVLLLSLPAAMAYAAGYLFFLRGLALGPVSIVAAIMNLWAVFTMFFAFALMGQRLTPLQTLGALTIIAGATVASADWGNVRRQGLRLSAGVKEAVLGAFFFGIFWNISEVIAEDVGWLMTTLSVKVGLVLVLVLVARLSGQPIGRVHTPPGTKIVVGLMGLVEAGTIAVVNYGLTIGDAILITPIASALSVVTILLAVIFLQERLTRLQQMGIGAAVLGIIATGF